MGADKFAVRTVVVMLSVIALVGVVGVIWLVKLKIDPSSIAIVVALAGPAVGSLGTLLSRTSSSDTPQQVQVVPSIQPAPPQQVEVVNEPENPVPTTEGEK